jgi:hypothetical protein
MGCAHHFRPTYPNFLHGAPPTPACAAFIKESRMKFDNARKFDRKSGVRVPKYSIECCGIPRFRCEATLRFVAIA